MRDYTIKIGDTSLSPTWGVILSGEGVDFTEGGWEIRAQARTREGALILDWARDGRILVAEAAFTVPDADGNPTVITSSTIRLYLPPAFTADLTPRTLIYDVEIYNPTGGPLGDPLRYTVIDSASVRIRTDWAPN